MVSAQGQAPDEDPSSASKKKRAASDAVAARGDGEAWSVPLVQPSFEGLRINVLLPHSIDQVRRDQHEDDRAK